MNPFCKFCVYKEKPVPVVPRENTIDGIARPRIPDVIIPWHMTIEHFCAKKNVVLSSFDNEIHCDGCTDYAENLGQARRLTEWGPPAMEWHENDFGNMELLEVGVKMSDHREGPEFDQIN